MAILPTRDLFGTPSVNILGQKAISIFWGGRESSNAKIHKNRYRRLGHTHQLKKKMDIN